MARKKRNGSSRQEDDFGPSYHYVMPQEAWLVGIGYRFITGKLHDSTYGIESKSDTKTDSGQIAESEAKNEPKDSDLKLHICGDEFVTVKYNRLTTVLIGGPEKGHIVTVTTYAHNNTALCIERLL
ncbi:MAG: hypothetical protein NPIRA02_31750 [Nitrospirales bacterium]|nr:MAG: hypothetical protein NPIRA02_31750 [Nitrospirales bacterium]